MTSMHNSLLSSIAGRVVAALALFICIGFNSGCAHQTVVTTTSPGAEVYVEGEKVGVTPVTLTSNTGHDSEIFFDVRQDGESKRFAVPRDRFSASAALASIGVGVGLFTGGMVLIFAGTVAATLGVVIAPVNPQVGFSALIGSSFVMVIGSIFSSYSIMVPVLLIGEFGRALPDRVDVDWVSGDVRTSPSAEVKPLIGTVSGFRPHRPQANSDVGFE